MVLTPDGKIALYYYGVGYAPKDLRLGLIQACAKENRHGGGPGAPILLSLRFDNRQVRSHDFARVAAFRIGDGTGSGNSYDRLDPFWITTQTGRRQI